jgi:hypothetical protein
MSEIHKVTMEWTREKAIEMLSPPYDKKWLKKLTDDTLFELGIKEDLWSKIKDEK